MDSSAEAERLVQSVVCPSLLCGLLATDSVGFYRIGIDGSDTPPLTKILDQQTSEESNEVLHLALEQCEFGFANPGGTQALVDFLITSAFKLFLSGEYTDSNG